MCRKKSFVPRIHLTLFIRLGSPLFPGYIAFHSPIRLLLPESFAIVDLYSNIDVTCLMMYLRASRGTRDDPDPDESSMAAKTGEDAEDDR